MDQRTRYRSKSEPLARISVKSRTIARFDGARNGLQKRSTGQDMPQELGQNCLQITQSVQQQPAQQSAQPPPAPSGVNGNPWGYDFNPGNYITAPPSAFCSYFNCIASFWNGKGHVEECQDATYSKSGGISGSCSHHGGDWRALYSH